MDSSDLQPQITTSHTYISPATPSALGWSFHLTRLTSTLFIWVGTASPSEAFDDESGALGRGEGGGQAFSSEKKLAGEWGVAMPSRGNIPAVATPIFRSGSSDIAVPMSQRLARKFPSNQIHLSLSLPASLTAPSGPGLDPMAGRSLLIMEKELGKWLEQTLDLGVSGTR